MKKNERLHSLLHFTEGKILFVGSVFLSIYLLALLFSWIFFPKIYGTFTAITASHFFFGRAAGISVGLAAGLPTLGVVLINVFIESVMVLLVYPVFVLSWNKLLNVGRWKTWIEHSRKSAEKYHPMIHKYGIAGLFVFVWFPFWMTGPVVGSIIGYLMRLGHAVTLSVVLIGTFIATLCWAWFLQFLQNWASTIDPRAPWLMAGGVILLVIIGIILRKPSK